MLLLIFIIIIIIIIRTPTVLRLQFLLLHVREAELRSQTLSARSTTSASKFLVCSSNSSACRH